MVHKTSLLEAMSTFIETNTSLSSLLNFSNPIISHDLIILLIVLFNIQFNIHLSHTWKKNCNDINVIIAICPGMLVQDDSSSLQLSTPSSNYKGQSINSSKAHEYIRKPVHSKAEFATYEAEKLLSCYPSTGPMWRFDCIRWPTSASLCYMWLVCALGTSSEERQALGKINECK